MKTAVLLAFATLGAYGQGVVLDASDGTACWKSSSTRGAGKVMIGPDCQDPSSCCMTDSCTAGPDCAPAGSWQSSETGSCTARAGGLCTQTSCASGYTDFGLTCTKGLSTYAKFTCTNSIGCYNSEYPVQDAGLCYPECPQDTSGIGPVCWGGCGGNYPVDGGAMCCKTTGDCSQEIVDDIKNWLSAGGQCAGAEVDPVACVKAAAQAAYGMVLPVCSDADDDQSDMATQPTSTVAAGAHSGSASSVNTGGIVGGTIAGCAAVALMVGAAVRMRKSKEQEQQQNAAVALVATDTESADGGYLQL